MSAGMWAEDFPPPRHDLRCRIWLQPIGACDCRDAHGRATPLTTAARLDLLVPAQLACDTDIEEAS